MFDEKDNRCIVLCRVSSKEQEDRGYSLEAQEKLLTQYAEKQDLRVVKIFKITESASGKQIRKIFNEMLSYVKKQKVNVILCEKIDRLTRNLKDAAIISDWVHADDKRIVHFVKENFSVSRNTRAHENLVWDMKVAIARFYTNNLSEEVRKGQNAKVESGWLANGFKPGYTTVGEKGKKTCIVDPNVAPHIVRMFELYDTVGLSIIQIANKLYEEGARNRNGRKIGKTSVHRILIDPFYAGHILWHGKKYAGKHTPLITQQMFDRVQEKLRRHYTNGQSQNHDYVFKGMINCTKCGYLVSWEVQKGHYYGRCKGHTNCVKKGFIRQEKVEDQLCDLLDAIRPRDKDVLDWINQALKEKNQEKVTYTNETRQKHTDAINKIEGRLDRMYEDRLDGVITDEYYQRKSEEYKREKRGILEQMEGLEDRVENYYEIGLEIHRLAFNARGLYFDQDTTSEQKRILLKRLFARIELDTDQKITITPSPAYEFLALWMPRLNLISEPSKKGSTKRKTGSLEPAHPVLLGGWDSNPRPIGYIDLLVS